MSSVRNMIDSNTVCLVGSAPDFAFGIVDPIPALSVLALEFGINLHVDACMGGYIMAFTEAAGFKVPHEFDFKVPGVTSISCDPHKYCRGPKGCSVLMFRTKELRRLTFSPVSDWSGGLYVTPTLAGTRSG